MHVATRTAQLRETQQHKPCSSVMMLLVSAALLLLFYNIRDSELESYALLAFHPGNHKHIAVRRQLTRSAVAPGACGNAVCRVFRSLFWTRLDMTVRRIAPASTRALCRHPHPHCTSLHPLPHPPPCTHPSSVRLATPSRSDPCDDSDGADKTIACQIRCGSSCIEPYRLCLAHSECSAIAMSDDLSFATLKHDLFPHIARSAAPIRSLTDWQAWVGGHTPKNSLPHGSYKASCSDCSATAGVLHCLQCGTSSGTQLESRVELSRCGSGSFENDDGKLRCSEQKSYQPGAHKQIAVTTRNGAGVDFPCADSDGSDGSHACQIHCGTPCMEPYRLCLAYAECNAIALNTDLSFATLKVSLFSHVALSATPVSAVAEWHAYLRNASRHLSGQPRHFLVVATAGFGRSFSCPDSEVDDGSTCTFKCRSVHCTDAYALCIAHEECDVVELNAPRLSWATLKTGVEITSLRSSGEEGGDWGGVASVANRSQWHVMYRAALAVANATKPSSWLAVYEKLKYLAYQGGELQTASSRPVVLSRSSATDNYDFGCAEGEGLSESTCEFSCEGSECLNAYHACLEHIQCFGVHVHLGSSSARATLKTYVVVENKGLQTIVLNEGHWRQQFLAQGRQARHQPQPGLQPSVVGSL